MSTDRELDNTLVKLMLPTTMLDEQRAILRTLIASTVVSELTKLKESKVLEVTAGYTMIEVELVHNLIDAAIAQWEGDANAN